MAITKTMIFADLKVIGEFSIIEVRQILEIVDDGAIVFNEYHRHVVLPGNDYSKEHPQVQAACILHHTDAVIAAYAAKALPAMPSH